MMRIVPGDFNDPRVIALLKIHLVSAGRKRRQVARTLWTWTGCNRPTSVSGRFGMTKRSWGSVG